MKRLSCRAVFIWFIWHILIITGTWINLECRPNTTLKYTADRLWLVATIVSSTQLLSFQILITTGKKMEEYFNLIFDFYQQLVNKNSPERIINKIIWRRILLLLCIFFLIALFYGIDLWEKVFLASIQFLHHIYALMLIAQKEE